MQRRSFRITANVLGLADGLEFGNRQPELKLN